MLLKHYSIIRQKSEILEITDDMEVTAGDSGTFDIRYTIRGGTIETIDVEPENFWIISKN
jgi:hypothetical protein